MSKTKFKTGQMVIVRRPDTNWCVDIYSYNDGDEYCPHRCTGDYSYHECLPFTPETAHLVGTKHEFVMPIPEEHRFTCGQWVYVGKDGVPKRKVLYLRCRNPVQHGPCHQVFDPAAQSATSWWSPENISDVSE